MIDIMCHLHEGKLRFLFFSVNTLIESLKLIKAISFSTYHKCLIILSMKYFFNELSRKYVSEPLQLIRLKFITNFIF